LRRRRSSNVVAAAVAAATLSGPLNSPALAEDLPSSALTVLTGLRHGASEVSDDIGYGWTIGLSATWQPMTVGQRLGWGIGWSLMWTWFGDEPASDITGGLDLIELDVYLRARFAPTPSPGRVLTVGAGGMLLRANERLPPDGDRSYFGPMIEVGYEHLVYGPITATLHLRLGPLTGPSIASAILGVGVVL
jgi:hypothetical protein